MWASHVLSYSHSTHLLALWLITARRMLCMPYAISEHVTGSPIRVLEILLRRLTVGPHDLVIIRLCPSTKLSTNFAHPSHRLKSLSQARHLPFSCFATAILVAPTGHTSGMSGVIRQVHSHQSRMLVCYSFQENATFICHQATSVKISRAEGHRPN